MRGHAAGSGAPRGVARGWARADRGGGAAARCGLGWAAKALRKQLETSFECSLADYKDLIKEEIEAFLDAQEAALGAGEAEDSGADGESASVSGSESGSGGAPKAKVKGGFGVCELSQPLATLLGEERMGRTEVVKALWAYIKGKDLQNPKDRRKIVLDEGLGTVFKHPLTMFNMNKQLSRHLHYRDAMQSKADSQPDPKKPKKRKASAAGGGGAGAKKAKQNGKDAKKGGKKKSGGGGGFGKTLVKEPLASLVGGTEMPRSEVIRLVWAHIKEHDLQDPQDRRQVLVSKDPKLSQFLSEPCTMFSINKQLAPYMEQIQGEKKERKKTGGVGLKTPVALSPGLAKVLGEAYLSRSQVVKGLWAYIREHDLQDPKDRRNIILDETLGKLFKDPLTMFTMNKQIGQHLGPPKDAPPPAAKEEP